MENKILLLIAVIVDLIFRGIENGEKITKKIIRITKDAFTPVYYSVAGEKFKNQKRKK